MLPFLDLRELRAADVGRDVAASLAVAVMAVPQGIAYAMIAGLPPAAGLYAATLPAILGGLFRSSPFVVSGPTNALSLLVGGATATLAAQLGASPSEVAITLALMVGVMQMSAGLLRLGALVDYISSPVVLGYITGAGVLIGAGQLHHLTGSAGGSGTLFSRLWTWGLGLGETQALPLAIGLGTLAVLVALRRFAPKVPGAVVGIGLAVLATWMLDLRAHGLVLLADLTPVPASLPPLTKPSLENLDVLLPVAFATTVLSLVESTAVARTLATRSGRRLESSTEFFGQGLANISAAFVGGYPVSGSLARSSLLWAAGGRSRLAGVLSGVLVLLALLVAGPVVNLVPVASLAGLLMLVAWDLVDLPKLKRVVRSRTGDAMALAATILGTWVLRLDQAIYLGVAISVVMFLRRARLLEVRDLVVDKTHRMREVRSDRRARSARALCSSIRVLHVEGAAFFGAAGELQDALHEATLDPKVKVLLVRTKRMQGMDFTTASVFGELADQLRAEGRTLVMVGMRREALATLRASGSAARIGRENLFPTRPRWFWAMEAALRRCLEIVGDHEEDGPCPYAEYLDERSARRASSEARRALEAASSEEEQEPPVQRNGSGGI